MKGSALLLPLMAVFIVLFSTAVKCEDVPESLPHFKAIRLYQTYLEQPSPSAFAVSRSGAYSASWQQESILAARENALAECEKLQLGTPCEIVSENGVATVASIDIKNLKGKFRDAQGRIWPPMKAGTVPQIVATDPLLIAAYGEYAKKRGMKAFAVSAEGKWGDASGHITEFQARQVAVSQCQSQLQGRDVCRVIDVNNAPLVPVSHISDEQ